MKNNIETMIRQASTHSEFKRALRTICLRYPEAEQSIACKGTPLECTTFKARNKAFLFVSDAEIKLKLGPTLAEATRLASKEPGRYQAGSIGWVTVKFNADGPPPLELLEKWIDESYRLLAHRKLVALLPERRLTVGASPKAATRQSARKKSPYS